MDHDDVIIGKSEAPATNHLKNGSNWSYGGENVQIHDEYYMETTSTTRSLYFAGDANGSDDDIDNVHHYVIIDPSGDTNNSDDDVDDENTVKDIDIAAGSLTAGAAALNNADLNQDDDNNAVDEGGVEVIDLTDSPVNNRRTVLASDIDNVHVQNQEGSIANRDGRSIDTSTGAAVGTANTTAAAAAAVFATAASAFAAAATNNATAASTVAAYTAAAAAFATDVTATTTNAIVDSARATVAFTAFSFVFVSVAGTTGTTTNATAASAAADFTAAASAFTAATTTKGAATTNAAFTATYTADTVALASAASAFASEAAAAAPMHHLLEHHGTVAENRGATAREIALLPVATDEENNIALVRGDTCGFCLEEYKAGNQLKTLPCIHTFHQACIDEWLQINYICPIRNNSNFIDEASRNESWRSLQLVTQKNNAFMILVLGEGEFYL